MRVPSLLILLALPLPAAAQQRESIAPPTSGGGPPERIVLPVAEPGCALGRAEDNTILVCGRRGDPYRIDPVVLATEQARRDLNKRRPNRGDVPAEPCNLVGPAVRCPTDVITVSGIALTAIQAVVKAARGEDLRPMLRAEPTEYELFVQAKAQADAKAKAKADEAAGTGPGQPSPARN